MVTREYNHSFPASLKQTIDYAYDEWQAKPVGFLSYGCGSIGLHTVDQLRTVFTALHAVTVRGFVGVDPAGRRADAAGRGPAARGPGGAPIRLLNVEGR
ncbi:NADPH-dependent FMN reductase [Micromonospora sp. SL1-18]|uniref:NADPH-dependent FMN reductase n=1 Tax=Micromonospora sp. SL1-18 TaxID=3399128 RepID=UPI003A4D6BB8